MLLGVGTSRGTNMPRILAAAPTIVTICVVFAQSATAQTAATPVVFQPVKHDISPPLRDIVPIPSKRIQAERVEHNPPPGAIFNGRDTVLQPPKTGTAPSVAAT